MYMLTISTRRRTRAVPVCDLCPGEELDPISRHFRNSVATAHRLGKIVFAAKESIRDLQIALYENACAVMEI